MGVDKAKLGLYSLRSGDATAVASDCLRHGRWRSDNAKDGYVHDFLFVCLFVVFLPTREFFTRMETSTLPVKAYARHSWPFSSEGSLVCQAYCYTGNMFIMVMSEDL